MGKNDNYFIKDVIACGPLAISKICSSKKYRKQVLQYSPRLIFYFNFLIKN